MRVNKVAIIAILCSVICFFNACDAKLLGASISPKTFDYGFVEIVKTQTFIISNNTSDVIRIEESNIIGANSTKFHIVEGLASFNIMPHTSKYMKISFTPEGYGQMSALLVLETSFSGTRIIRVDLTGFGLVAEFDPKSYDFGTVDSTQSAQSNFTIYNKTKRNLVVRSFDITGTDSAHFNIVSGTPGTLIAETGAIQVTVEFRPFTHRLLTAKLNANTTDSNFPIVSAELSGTGNVILKETFDTTTMSDTNATTADWGITSSGEMTATGFTLFGTGVDGDYNPTSSANLDADAGPYNFTSINIPSGVVITVTGTQALEIMCQGDVEINGKLILDGTGGGDYPNGTAGVGGPGGYNGGTLAQNGNGPGAGSYSTTGGGAGHAQQGQNGTRGGNGGGQYGSADLATLDGGSGGAGGTNAGGGGGGGAVQITAAGFIEIAGLISANGGWGGGNPGNNYNLYYGGGGGSGGAVKLVSAIDIMFTGGSISVQGGGAWGGASQANTYARGGFGSPGRVRLEDADGIVKGVGGSIFPTPSAKVVSTPFAGGTGADGVFSPTSSTTLNTSNSPFNYTSVNIPAGVTVKATGSQPLEIYCTGNITIAGIIDVSGGDSTNTTSYGIGVAGGGNGGPVAQPGSGPGAGQTATGSYSSGSGGGYGEVGQIGGYRGRAPGGLKYGNEDLYPLLGGSGGGGGLNAPGAAGGGAVRLQAAGEVKITGQIIANGGNAYIGSFSCAGPGGGGSGGAILVQGNDLNITGSLSARGGRGGATTGCGSGGYYYYKYEAIFMQGGWGAFGRIRLESVIGNAGGIVMSTKSKFPLGGTNNLITGTCSIDNITINAGLFGQSKFYDTTLTSPIWKSAVINGNDLNKIIIQFQGADDDGSGNPDLTTVTQWFDDLKNVPQKQYVRFRAIFNVGSTNASIEDIELLFD